MLFFCPEAGIIQHQTLMRALALMAVDSGQAAAGVTCWRMYQRCPAISANRPPAFIADQYRRQICRRCLGEALKEPDARKLPKLWLPDYWTRRSEETLKEALENFDYDPLGSVLNGIAFGRICTLDLALACKTCNFQRVQGAELVIWRQLVASAVSSYLLVHEIHKRSAFKHFIYFNDYATNIAGALAAKENGCCISSISQASNQNIDRRRVLIFPDFVSSHNSTVLNRWTQWKNLSLNKARVQEIGTDAIARLSGKGSHVYSKGLGELPAKLSTKRMPHFKRIVAFTSSLDEVSSAGLQLEALTGSKISFSSPFGDDLQMLQSKWLQSVVEWAHSRGDIEVIIRVHPREGANKREKESSAHLVTLKIQLSNVPDCCTVIWPEDDISSYQLGETADVVLTAWSTIGLEFARLGVPVLSATSGLSPLPNERFHRFQTNKLGYFNTLEQMLKSQSSLDDITLAYRFWNFLILGSALELDDLVPTPDYSGRISFKMPANGASFVEAMQGTRSALEINEARWLSLQSAALQEEEMKAVCTQSVLIIKRLLQLEENVKAVRFISCSPTLTNNTLIPYMNNLVKGRGDKPSLAIIGVSADDRVLYQPGGSINYRIKYSPLVARLLPLVAPAITPEQLYLSNTQMAQQQ
jgi:hypothetical protein